MPASLALGQLQRFLQAAVVHPGGSEAALDDARASGGGALARLGQVVLPSSTLTPGERIGIYREMYPLRMQEALATDYPALQHFLGERAFLRLAIDYVQAYPSRSYTLNRLGDHLPEFILNTPGIRRREFCADLARLELACTEVFDADETRPLSEAEIGAIAPEDWERAVLAPVAAFRLLALRHNADEYLQSLKDDSHEHPKPRRKAAFLAVFRRDYAVYRRELTRDGHDLLADLVSGRPVGEALGAALRRGRRGKPDEEQLFRWFREWASGGVFGKVRVVR